MFSDVKREEVSIYFALVRQEKRTMSLEARHEVESETSKRKRGRPSKNAER